MRSSAFRFRAGIAALLLLALLAGGAGLGLGVRLPRVSDLWPLDLARPGGVLVSRQLADLRTDYGLCRSVLIAPQIESKPVPDGSPGPGCGWFNAVQTTRVAGARLGVTPVTCELAAAVALWMEHVVQPRALELLGSKVAAVDHLGSYACRNIRGSPGGDDERSEHASANALDVNGFRLADGRRVRVLSDWGRDTPEGRFLAAIHSGACRYFSVAIGPAYNEAHRDHFHFDRGDAWACQ